MKYPKWLDREQRKLAEERTAERAHALRLILEGNVLNVEPDRERLARVIADRVKVAADTAAAIAAGVPLETLDLTAAQIEAARDMIEADNSVPMTFADQARSISKAVGRVTTRNGRPMGSCFMISRRLLATADHVLRNADLSARRVEFNFEERDSVPNTRARFTLAPDAFFLSRDELGFDCAIVALGESVDGTAFMPGHCPLSDRGNKHALGFFANLIHHPGRKTKQFVLRENRLIDRPDESRPNGGAGVGDRRELLAYRGQTDGGSSGAPVFNDVFDVVAVHFWGATLQPLNLGGLLVRDHVNHGVRASAIIEKLQELRPGLTATRQELVDQAIRLGGGVPGLG